MIIPISYDEYFNKHVTIEAGVEEECMELHGISIRTELDKIIRKDYEAYIKKFNNSCKIIINGETILLNND